MNTPHAPSLPLPSTDSHSRTIPEKHVVALYSGGLDSILAIKLLEAQGVRVTPLHFVTPFFGKPHMVHFWKKTYKINPVLVDIGEEYVEMLVNRPAHGFGKVLNPCVDCKILMLRKALKIMQEMGASAIISGEVLGQRAMSQRSDALNLIRNEARVKDVLVRPLSALKLPETAPEQAGIIDRSRLLGIYGRGRKDQMALAAQFGITIIPTPGGGCNLGEKEKARSYWQILTRLPSPTARDFYLADGGRQLWAFGPVPQWLIIGRNQDGNDILMQHAGPDDVLLKARDFSGPIALFHGMGREPIPLEELASTPTMQQAAALAATYSPKAMKDHTENNRPVIMRLHKKSLDAPGLELPVTPTRENTPFAEAVWDVAHEEIRAENRIRAQKQS